MELHFLTLISEELIIVQVRKSLMKQNREFVSTKKEEKQFVAAEQDEVQEVPVSKKKPQEEEKKKIQRQITSFISKKKE